MSNQDFELIRIKNSKDIQEALERNGRVFITWKKRLFCKDIFREMLVEWAEDHWEERPFDALPEGEGEEQEDDRAIAFAGGVKPWPLFHQMQAKKEAEWKARREKEIAQCKRQVIGWMTSPGFSAAFLRKEDSEEEEYDAVIRDIQQHGYLFAGEEHQDKEDEAVYPVLDDYRYHVFSRRGFGDLMAEAHGDFSEYGYARYTEARWPEEESRFPPKSKTLVEEEPAHEFELPDAEFDSFLSRYEYVSPCYFVLPLGKGHYWLDEKITLKCKEKSWSGAIIALHCFQSREEFDEYYELFEEYERPFREQDPDGEYPRLFALLQRD